MSLREQRSSRTKFSAWIRNWLPWGHGGIHPWSVSSPRFRLFGRCNACRLFLDHWRWKLQEISHRENAVSCRPCPIQSAAAVLSCLLGLSRRDLAASLSPGASVSPASPPPSRTPSTSDAARQCRTRFALPWGRTCHARSRYLPATSWALDYLIFHFRSNRKDCPELLPTVPSNGFTCCPPVVLPAWSDRDWIILWGGGRYYQGERYWWSVWVVEWGYCTKIEQETPYSMLRGQFIPKFGRRLWRVRSTGFAAWLILLYNSI